MIIFLYGQESFLSQQKAKEIINKYKQKHQSGLNFEIFDFEQSQPEKTFLKLEDFLKSLSMFNEKKLVVLKNVFSTNRDLQEKLITVLGSENLRKEQDKFVVLWEKGEPDKRSRLFKLLQHKEIQSQNFEKLKGIKLKSWILKEIKQRGGEIEGAVLDKLVIALGDNLWLISNEIDKLISYQAKIDEKSIAKLAGFKLKLNIFETIEAISGGRKELAWKLIYQHLGEGEEINYLFSMIVYQFRNLILIQEFLKEETPKNLIARKAKLHPFVVEKALRALRNMSQERLKSIYNQLADFDFKIKIGLIEPRLAIDILVGKN